MTLRAFSNFYKQQSHITWHQDFIENPFPASLPLVFATTFPAGRGLSVEDEPDIPGPESETPGSSRQVEASSAYPLAPERRAALESALAPLVGDGTSWTYTEDPELIAGLRIAFGAWVLRANLRDELETFAEVGRDNT
jgi:hypothetical protein